MGFSFKYTLEDMYRGAIETCREKGLLPYSTQFQNNGGNKKSSLDPQKKHSGNQETDLLPISKEKHVELQENGKIYIKTN